MIILGVNGWFDRGHDASACIVQNGQLIAAVEEERLIGKKHAYDTMPLNSIAWCLSSCEFVLDDIDAVAVGWNIPRLYSIHHRDLPFQGDKEYLDILLPSKYFGRIERGIPVHFIDHHRAHAASAFYLSGFSESLVFVIDGQGEDVATTVWEGRHNMLSHIASFPVAFSLGYFFETISSFIGFSASHAGKTMGLAGYGKVPCIEFFHLEKGGYFLGETLPKKEASAELDEQVTLYNYWGEIFEDLFGAPNRPDFRFSNERSILFPESEIGDREQNIAALAQHEIERVILHLVNEYTRSEGIRNVCLAGGVALNCSCNGKIIDSGLVNNLFIQPASYDAGAAIGAALEVARSYTESPSDRMELAGIGPAYTDEEIAHVLREVNLQPEVSDDIAIDAAYLLAKGKVIGWVQDGMEIGPRALGSRSILADPRSLKMRDTTNKVKGREQWRPLSPSVLSDRSDWLLGRSVESLFMLLGLPVTKSVKDKVAGIVHVDDSTRVQTVTPKLERYYRLISEFETLTGVPLILNTSFNGPGDPIVCTPFQALNCFFSRPLDVLILGNCILRKR